MRKVHGGVEAPRTTTNFRRRTAAVMLAGSVGLGAAGCGLVPQAKTNTSGALKTCELSWEDPNALTDNPSGAHTSMQQAIAKLIDEVAKSGAKKSEFGFQVDSIPQNLVGTANAVLDQTPEDRYVHKSSRLQNYTNEVCQDDITYLTYLTPDYLSAVGSLAAAGITVDAYTTQPTTVTP